VDRFRWLLTFVAIVFVAVLGAIGSAPHAVAAPAAPVAEPDAIAEPFELAFDEADEEGEAEASWDEGEEVDPCESEDEAREEACEEATEEKELEEAEAEECRLESAEATVATVPGRDELRLTVRYKAFEPSVVAIALRLHGAKGGLDLGTDTARFGRSGTLHSTEKLSDRQMARALAAKEFAVGIQAINTPGFCRQSFERHLTARKGAAAGRQWSDPAAARRAKASRPAA
jgi:hypothetical protein